MIGKIELESGFDRAKQSGSAGRDNRSSRRRRPGGAATFGSGRLTGTPEQTGCGNTTNERLVTMTKQPITQPNNASERIRQAATTLFKTRGYHGTAVRALASIVKIEAGSLYYHFPSKQQILFENVARTVDAFIDGLRQVLEAEAGVETCLSAAVR